RPSTSPRPPQLLHPLGRPPIHDPMPCWPDPGAAHARPTGDPMTGTVVRGPWIGPPVQQNARPPITEWWERQDDGTLLVRCGDRIHTAPVPPADLTQPLPARPPNRDRIT